MGLCVSAALVAPLLVGQELSFHRHATPKTYGTTDVSYIEVPGTAFFPMAGPDAYTSDYAGLRWGTSGTVDFMAPMPRVPAGAQIVYLELDYEDNSTFWFVDGSLTVCDYLGQTCSQHPAAGAGALDCASPGYICSGYAAAPGPSSTGADLTGDNIFVNNYDYAYSLFARVQGGGGLTKLAGMIIGYRLQVSAPASGAPHFNDVPVGDPAYQFIEALYASGISVGCGGGNYCPDATLTRRQMAVFLAKALGLHFQ
jgi:hypothetical protein